VTKEVKAPKSNSGKTRFNRGKAKGESWIDRRTAAVAKGEFVLPKKHDAQ
jgi:hypothetical protein